MRQSLVGQLQNRTKSLDEFGEISPEMYERIAKLVASFVRCKRERIKPDTRLFHDLNVDGLDALNLMQKVETEFSVDMTEFVFSRHFGAEVAWNPLAWIYSFIFERDKLNEKGTAIRTVPITILDLCIAATTKSFPDLQMRNAE